MRANLTISLAIGLAIHVARELCENADIDVAAGRTLGPCSVLAAHNLRDLVCGMPKAARPMIRETVMEYTRRYLRTHGHGRDDRRALRTRIFATLRHAISIASSSHA